MKKALFAPAFASFLFLAIHLSSIAAPVKGHLDTVPHTLRTDRFDLTLSSVPPSNKNILSLNEASFRKRFGKPKHAANEFSEVDDKNIKHLRYDGMDVWFLDNQLNAIDINSSKYAFKLMSGPVIRVGDQIGIVRRLLQRVGEDRPAEGKFFVGLSTRDYAFDMNLLFEYDRESGVIRGISVQD
jgi:hypothetical protein